VPLRDGAPRDESVLPAHAHDDAVPPLNPRCRTAGVDKLASPAASRRSTGLGLCLEVYSSGLVEVAMYKRILVPIDGSQFSEQILPYVAYIKGKTGVAVELLRVVDKDENKVKAHAALETLAHDLPAAAICAVNEGGVAQTILNEAAHTPGTLVAISSHGRSGLLRAVLGSTALDVLRNGREPICVFRPQENSTKRPVAIERIVLPLDGSELSESMVPLAAELARWIGARIVVASVIEAGARDAAVDVTESSYARTQATQLGQRYGIDVGWEALHGDPSVAIPAFVRSLPNTMLAMTTRGHSAVHSAFLGSVTAACVRDSGAPIFARLP
jgi:nucleotide-binding universal stress UspA family protein